MAAGLELAARPTRPSGTARSWRARSSQSLQGRGRRFARWSGTSLSAPTVAEQTALVRAKLLLGLVDKVANAVTGTTDRIASGGVQYGAVDVVDSLNRWRACAARPPFAHLSLIGRCLLRPYRAEFVGSGVT